MKFVLNGKDEELSGRLSLSELLKNNNLAPEKTVVEFNGQILDKNQWHSTILKDNDVVEVVSFVGGG